MACFADADGSSITLSPAALAQYFDGDDVFDATVVLPRTTPVFCAPLAVRFLGARGGAASSATLGAALAWLTGGSWPTAGTPDVVVGLDTETSPRGALSLIQLCVPPRSDGGGRGHINKEQLVPGQKDSVQNTQAWRSY